jgi:prephenate dehydratase
MRAVSCTVVEELTLDVKLALLGRPGEEITSIHSHAMPFYHGDDWLKANYPERETHRGGQHGQSG